VPLDEETLSKWEEEFTVPFVSDTPPWPLYHYTDAAGFLGIVRDGMAWATYFPYMNDREECVGGERMIDSVAHAGAASAKGVAKQFYETFLKVYERQRFSKRARICVVSLSENGDLLSQWRAYAAGGGGYSIGFGDFPLPKEATPGADYALALIMRVQPRDPSGRSCGSAKDSRFRLCRQG
jgi:hypothetical protein